MPTDFVRDWVAPNGMARIQVFPKDTSGTDASLREFGAAVTQVAPDATGAPLSIRQSGDTIMGAFVQAGLLAFIAITILLFIVLRRMRDVLLTLRPAVAERIAHARHLRAYRAAAQFRQRHRAAAAARHRRGVRHLFRDGVAGGAQNLLQSSLTRAVIFSALTTASGFGTLWLSSHPGTASMGELLMISLAGRW